MHSRKRYLADLTKLGRYKDAVQRFGEAGQRPDDNTLLALLCGEWPYILNEHLPELALVFDFMEHYYPDAFGSLQKAAAWESVHETYESDRHYRPHLIRTATT